MTKPKDEVFYDYAIIGAGAAGLHLAMSMHDDPFYHDKKILIIDKDKKISDDRTWCYWENGAGKWDSLLTCTWDKIHVGYHNREKLIPLQEYRYKMLKSKPFYAYCLEKIKTSENFTLVFDEVLETRESNDKVLIQCNSKTYTSSQLFSSILDYKPEASQHPYLWQHFGGWFIKCDEPVFKGKFPHFMNFNIDQENRTQFMYILPFSDHEALFEFTIFSKDVLENEEYEKFVESYLHQIHLKDFTITEKEFGKIPMTTFPFWHKNTDRKMYIGSAGGWTKPSTGYTFYFCQKYARKLSTFLRKSEKLSSFRLYNRFFWFDRILLEVLAHHNRLGSDIFANMFEKNTIASIFSFLNNESTIFEDFKIILKTKYPHLFFKAFIHTLQIRSHA